MEAYRKANSYLYSKHIRNAEEIIRVALLQCKNPAIALSGGKDSVAMAGLVCKFCSPKIIWNDSGLELPESKSIIYEIADRFGLEIIVAKGCAIEEAEAIGRGELSRYDKKVINSIDTIINPVRKALIEHGIDLEFVGLRKKESIKRRMLLSQYGPIHYSKKWGIKIAWPMMNWDGRDCLAYICENNLPIHPAYLMASDPAMARVSWAFDTAREAPAETEVVRRNYPEIYRKLREAGLCQ